MKLKRTPLLLTAALLQTATPNPIQPSPSRAEENAFQIFNSIHSAMRQWGSSLNHNGMAFIPATIPRGTLFYHGSPFNSTPAAPEWLAFEMEHAENFARARPYRVLPPRPPPSDKPEHQKPLGSPRPPDNATIRGYLHTFRTTRELSLLYVDGTSAGKTRMGTMDSQDFVLRLLDPADGPNPWDDYLRARELCGILTQWGYDGVIRMEIGFEVIFCKDFAGGGLETISIVRSPGLAGKEWPDIKEIKGLTWQWARGAGERYDRIGGGRAVLDFSRMVSALWYPVNSTNPDLGKGKEVFPRLTEASHEGRVAIRSRVEEVAGQGGGVKVDWQSVVDMVVTRYEKRLAYMVSKKIGPVGFAKEVVAATLSYVEYPPAPGDVTFGMSEEKEGQARARCAAQYLLPVEGQRGAWTQEDEMVYLVVSRVKKAICDALFDARMILEQAQPGLAWVLAAGEGRIPESARMVAAFQQGKAIVAELASELRWTTWKKCRGCDPSEICFVAMWPFGRRLDHDSPSCVSEQVFEGEEFWKDHYWDDFFLTGAKLVAPVNSPGACGRSLGKTSSQLVCTPPTPPISLEQ
ncbi:hypothetical protein OQA88_7947 [Cercophora sp. LCS_1]